MSLVRLDGFSRSAFVGAVYRQARARNTHVQTRGHGQELGV